MYVLIMKVHGRDEGRILLGNPIHTGLFTIQDKGLVWGRGFRMHWGTETGNILLNVNGFPGYGQECKQFPSVASFRNLNMG